MNRYPKWKYLLIIAVTLVGLLYALPNLYPEDPALQVSPASSEPLDEAALQARLKPLLIENGVEPKSMSGDEDKLLLRFDDTETQLKAFNLVKDALDSNFVTALNPGPYEMQGGCSPGRDAGRQTALGSPELSDANIKKM